MPEQFESISPYSEEAVGSTAAMDDAAIERALSDAERQAGRWAQSGFDERRALLEAVAAQLDQRTDELAGLVTAEMGKLASEARGEVEKCAWVCRYYAENAAGFLADEPVASDARRSLVAYQPLGPVLAVMPWNFPLWQVFRFAAPAIAAGNVGLLKHASNVMLCGEAIEDVFRRAGAARGLFTNLAIRSDKVAGLIADPRVRAVTLTGSEPAGRKVAAQAGDKLKKSVLELGGSDPFIVLDDADLALAVDKGIQSRFMNAGQSCIAAKRFVVVDAVLDEFQSRLVDAASKLKVGDPSDPASTLAPMARADLRSELHEQVVDAVDAGAQLLCGGKPVEGRGWFYPATVLTGVEQGMRAYSEELFGPVATVMRADDERHAIQLANDTGFGLGGSVWTKDRDRGLEVARRLECGCAFVNELVKSDPRLPFGGIKHSGYGRELSRQGIREFVNTKSIWIE